MVYPDTFTGFQVNGPETWTEFHKNEVQPKPCGDYDVDIKIVRWTYLNSTNIRVLTNGL
jgi:hypothetical protein